MSDAGERATAESVAAERLAAERGLEPVSAIPDGGWSTGIRDLAPGVRVRLRGRSIHLRSIRRPRTGPLRLLAVLGPGLIAGAAGNDAGGVATYSQVGATLGYGLLWALALVTVSLAVVQETAARLGAATGRGLLDLIRERFGIGPSLVAVVALLVANAAVTLSEFVGIGAAMELLGVDRVVAIPIAAVAVWYLVVVGSYARTERIFVLMALVFLAYPVAALFAGPDPAEIARGFVPSVGSDERWLLLFVGLVGTTVSPYLQVFQQGLVVERGTVPADYDDERLDTYLGALFSNLMAMAIIVAVAATVGAAGGGPIETADGAALALEPVAGPFATTLFAVGLLGASLLAAAVLPLATAYSVAETFGLPKGIGLDRRRAPGFFGLFTILVAGGAIGALIPGLPVIDVLVGVQVLNGLLMPLMLAFMLVLANDRTICGPLANRRRDNILGWGTWLLMTTLALVYVGTQLLGG